MAVSEEDALYEIGRCRVDVRAETLTVDGQAVPLAPKVFATLALLVRNRGRVMTREELMATLWPDTFVSEANLSQNVFVLRQALGDGKFIETVPRRGYRFVAPVTLAERPPQPAPRLAGEGAPGAEAAVAPVPAFDTDAPPRKSRLPLAIGAMLVLAAAGAALLQPRASRRSARAPRPSVAVLGFQNLSDVESAGWLGMALAEMLDAELAAGGTLHLVPGESVSRLKRETPIAEGVALAPETLARVRQALAADYVVTGSYVPLDTPEGKRLRLQVRLQEAASGETLTAHAETGADSELFALVSRTAAVLRQRLSAGSVSDEQRAGLRRAVPQLEATRRSYYGGLARLRSLDEKGAIELLQASVEAEPTFAPAHAALAEAWASLGYDAKARQAAQTAASLAAGLSREESLLLQARVSDATRAWDKAADLYSGLWRFYPDDMDYGVGLANALAEGGNGRKALEVVDTLRRAGTSDPRVDVVEAKAADSVSDFDRAVAAADRAIAGATRGGSTTMAARALLRKGVSLAEKGRADEAIPLFTEAGRLFRALGDRLAAARAANGLANLLADKGDLDAARRQYQESLAAAEEAGSVKLVAAVLNNLGILAKDRGELAQALVIFERADAAALATGTAQAQSLALGNRGVVLRNLGRLEESRQVFERSVTLNRGVGNREGVARDLLNLGDADIRAGDLPAARHHLDEGIAIAREIGHSANEGGSLMGIAEVLAWEGKPEQALKTAEAAAALRKQHGQDAYGAASTLELSFVQLAAGLHTEAAESARVAAEFFRKERYLDPELVALARRARALAALGKVGEAQAPLARAAELARTSQMPWSRLELALAQAEVLARKGDPEGAARTARLALVEARRHHLVPLELSLRRILVRLGSIPGQPAPEPAEALARDATRLGFRLILVGLPPAVIPLT